MNPSLRFFLPEHEYMELELRSVEQQGAHEAGGAPWWVVLTQGGPLVVLASSIFLYLYKKILTKFRSNPRTFISSQKQLHGSSAKNNVSPG